MNKNVTTTTRIKPIQKKTNKALVTLYIEVKLYQSGLNIETVRVSTGITIEKNKWQNNEIKGRDLATQFLNKKLLDFLNITNILLDEIKLKKIQTIQEVKSEIENNLSERTTGKVKRGAKTETISKLKTYTYEYVLEHKLKNESLSIERKRQYQLHLNLIKEYYHGEIPPLSQFTKKEVENIKKWLEKKYTNTNTLTTRLSYFSAVLKYAYDVLELIDSNPIPKKFHGCYERGKRDILTENEQMTLLNFPYSDLSYTEKIAKHSFNLMLLTGIGYGDLKTMEYENIKENEHGIYLEKSRNKTQIPFKIYLSENANYHLKELLRLTSTKEKPFNLPSLDYSNRMFKRFGKKAGIEKTITSYVARHTFAVNYMQNGGRIEDLQVILGHSNILITSRVYGKISDKRLSEQMKKQAELSPIHKINNRLIAV